MRRVPLTCTYTGGGALLQTAVANDPHRAPKSYVRVWWIVGRLSHPPARTRSISPVLTSSNLKGITHAPHKPTEPTQQATVLTAADLARQRHHRSHRRPARHIGRMHRVRRRGIPGASGAPTPGMTRRQLRRLEAAQARLAAEEAQRRQPPPCSACGLHTPIGRGHSCKVVADKALEKANAGQLVGLVNALQKAGLKVSKGDD